MKKQLIGIVGKRKQLIVILMVTILFGIYGTVHASPITHPQGLSPDTPYRLAFVTAGFAQATSNNIAAYNVFVTGQALASTALADLNTGWSVIGSTSAVDAKTNTATDPTQDASVPIYNLAGLMVASSYTDLWDGALLNPINVDQYGTAWAQKVFTGTATDGSGIAGYQLGADGDRVRHGESQLAGAGWTSGDWAGDLTSLHYYAISNVLGQQVSPVPEPATILLIGSGLAGLAAARRRKKLQAAL